MRRAKRGGELLEQAGWDPTLAGERVEDDPTAGTALADDDVFTDDRLRLIFTCCHPALAMEGRVALTLRALAGLTTADIARVPRARSDDGETPDPRKGVDRRRRDPIPGAACGNAPGTARGVLAVLYLLFNEGYAASGGEQLIRADLCAEAIRLGRMLVELMPDEPEATGLLALMLLSDSRRTARVSTAGDLITLEEQNRALWDADAIAAARALLTAPLRRRAVGPYQLQAAISACHAEAATVQETDWGQIAAL